MPAPLGYDHWWDRPTWNPFGGCSLASPGCTNCYAAQEAGTKTWPYARSARVHDGVTIVKDKRRIFNGKLTAAPDGHHLWTWPLKWRGAEHPKLGPGQPSLIFVGDMSDLFHEDRPVEIINRVCCDHRHIRSHRSVYLPSARRGWLNILSNSRRAL